VLIDWFTVIAQIINFLILVLLLRHFLYGRIIKAMDEREQRIASRLEDAERSKEEAAKETESLRTKNQEFEEKRQEMMAAAKEDAEHFRKELIRGARRDIDVLKTKWEQTLQKEKDSFIQGLRQLAGEQVYSIARRVIGDLADVEVESLVIRVFLDQISNMDGEKRSAITESASNEGGITVKSSFDIPEREKESIRGTLMQSGFGEMEIRYETDSDLILGIELRAHSQKIAWNLNDYVSALEDRTRHALEKRTSKDDIQEITAEVTKQDGATDAGLEQ
jgi:F-type H+-transporting ATPase subunit b